MSVIDDDIIDLMIDKFEFRNVEKTMQALDWTWGYEATKRTPAIQELKDTARRLLNDVREAYQERQADISIGTGGFTARATKYKDSPEGLLSLSFAVDDICESEIYTE